MSDRNNRSFNEQAYLLYYWFAEKRKELEKLQKSGDFGSKIAGDKLKDTASVHRVIGNYTVSNFVPKLMKRNKTGFYKEFMDLETKKITALVPYVKIYKVTKGKNIPFYFPASAERGDIYQLLQPGASLGGVGIKNFSMKFQGKDPFMRDKNIECNLSIYMDSAENLFRDPPSGYAPLADLITISKNKYIPLKEGVSKEVSADQVNRAAGHEIAVDIGYSIDDVSGLFTMEERTAIKNTNLFLRLTLTNHSIDIQPDGTCTINASFIGRISGLLQNSMYNALFSSPDFFSISTIFADDKEMLEREVNEEKKKGIQEEINSKIRTNTASRLRGLFEYLDGDGIKNEKEEDSRIHSISATSEDVRRYIRYVNKSPQALDIGGKPLPKAPKSEAPKSKDLDKQSNQKAEVKEEDYFGKEVKLHYVYMGDLVESFVYNTKMNLKKAIDTINSDKVLNAKKKEKKIKPLNEAMDNLKTFKVLFGELTFPLLNNKSVSVNLADVPISLSLLQKYFFERIQQTHALKYTLNNFLEDLVSKIYPMLLNDHLYKDAPGMKIKSVVKTMMVCGEKTSKLDSGNVNVDIKDLPDFLKRRNSLRRTKDDIDCMVIYAETSPEDSIGLSGDKKIDDTNGIYHLNLGKDRGLLKGISFSQVNQKYRKEALMLESVSLYDELKMPYNAQISMIGNNMFLPGSTIYINPSSVGFGDPRNKRSSAARLGLGGYYIITGVDTTYSNGVLSTELSAVFNSWPDSDKAMSPSSTMFADAGVFDSAVDKYGGKK